MRLMRLLTRTLFSIGMVLLFGLPVLSQNPGLAPPPKRKYKYDGKIVSDYDKVKDQTTVLIQLMPVKDVEDPHPLLDRSADHPRDWSTLGITMFFTYPGQTLITPKYVSIGFLYMALDPEIYEDHLLAAKLDSERIVLGKMKVLSTQSVVVRFAYKPYTRRILEIVVPYEQFLQLANAKKVRVSLGGFDFNLSKDHLDALHDLASRTVP